MDKLKFLFSRTNLTQPSTLKAIVQFLVAAGVFKLAPEAQDQVVEWLGFIIAGGQALMSLINFVRNEHKSAIVTATPTLITTTKEGPTP